MLVPALVLVLVALPLGAAAADPLKSEACGASLAALDQARRTEPGKVEALRQQATRACLGGTGEARRPAPVAQAPIVVPPPVIETEPAQPPLAPAPPPPLPPRPPVVTSCDPAGCWDSNGARLNRGVGDVLIGPRGGLCTTVGATVHCP